MFDCLGEETKMKKKLSSLMVLAVVLALLPAGQLQAKAPQLKAETTHTPGAQFEFPYLQGWAGTFTEGPFPGGSTIEWWFDVTTWTAWDELTDPTAPPLPNASQYTMIVRIYDSANPETRTLLLETLEHGTTTLANTTWRANGVVTEAYGDFSGWVGRSVHERGEFIMGPEGPVSGTSSFRIN